MLLGRCVREVRSQGRSEPLPCILFYVLSVESCDYHIFQMVN